MDQKEYGEREEEGCGMGGELGEVVANKDEQQRADEDGAKREDGGEPANREDQRDLEGEQ